MVLKEFLVNEYISLKLEGKSTIIYVKGVRFDQCKFLLLDIPIKEITSLNDIESIDEATERLDKSLETISDEERHNKIPLETEFWGHCSNLQVWAENDYDTRLLHSNLAFPLLKKLTEAGNSIAKKVFKEEIAKRIASRYGPVIEYLSENGYFNYLEEEELISLADEWVEYDGEKIPVFNHFLDLMEKGIEDLSDVNGLYKLDSIESLDLSENQLEMLPESIGNLITLKRFFLIDNQLKKLPESIGKLQSLQKLNLYRNQLKTLPESIGNLISLRDLWLHDNQLRNLPRSIEHLTLLESLILEGNQLINLPDSIGNLKSLTYLSLSKNKFLTLPESIGNLTSLQTLILDKNQLTTIPESIGHLKSLKILDLSSNQVTTLPESIGNLTSLENLILRENQLKTLPESIGNLTSLKELWLHTNHLTTLPESIGNLTSLKMLYLHENLLTNLPESIIKLTSLKELWIFNNFLPPHSKSKEILRDKGVKVYY